jgi:formyltetrahydrofolate-dependent phosphoribosylglycinamide formyltransferase
MNRKRKRVAVLISGRGSNMAALIAAARDPAYPAEICGVISDNAGAPGLAIAAANGIAGKVVARRDFADKAAHDSAIDATLSGLEAEIVALAGYMRLLTAPFVQKWQGRMINIHPALLPSFKGLETHRRALDAGCRIHGCTAHFVTPEMDDGPIIAQAAVPVLADDTEESLAGRVLKVEHKVYPMALALVCDGKARMESGRTVFDPAGFYERNAGQFVMAPELTAEEKSLEDLARFTP